MYHAIVDFVALTTQVIRERARVMEEIPSMSSDEILDMLATYDEQILKAYKVASQDSKQISLLESRIKAMREGAAAIRNQVVKHDSDGHQDTTKLSA
jgi:hypothetical protein